MAFRLTWSPAARCDLREIFAYIAEDDRAAAGTFVRSVVRAVERLPAFPSRDEWCPSLEIPPSRRSSEGRAGSSIGSTLTEAWWRLPTCGTRNGESPKCHDATTNTRERRTNGCWQRPEACRA